MWTLDMTLDLLSHYHQRATYGAVGGILNVLPRSVMKGRSHNARHSWVVNKKTLEPTDYTTTECDPHLYERDAVLTNEKDLRRWLKNPK